MKAWVLHGVNDIRPEEIALPQIQEGEVLVKVMAAGICGSDIPRIYTTGAHKHPIVIGHEFAGVVEACGKGTEMWLQKRVGIFPLIPCGKCAPCKEHAYEMCRAYDYLGSRCDGGFAEYAAVPAQNLIELSEAVSYEQAAMLEPMAVAVHAIRKGTSDFTLSKKTKITVCGLGTIGTLVALFLADAGYHNLQVIYNKEDQKQRLEALGVYAKKAAGESGLFFECVGKNETIALAAESAGPAGRIVLVGNPHSDMAFARNTYWKLLRNQLTVMGTWNSSFTGEDTDDWHYVLRRLEEEAISPQKLITHRFSLSELEQGFEIMRDKKENYCKIMMIR